MARPLKLAASTSTRPSYFTSTSPHLKMHDNKTISYTGPGETDRDSACARSNCPVYLKDTVFYFEVKIVDQGREGYIGIGLCSPHVASNRLPGWDQHSYGYHGDDGNTFAAGTALKYGPTFGTGDVIGCGINCLEATCFYTKNGTLLPNAFRGITRQELTNMHACVGLRSQGECVEVNFGDSAFVFDLESYVAELRRGVRASIAAVDVKTHQWTSALNTLVVEYLAHHGFGRSAQALATVTGAPLSESPESVAARTQVHAAIVAGSIDQALTLLRQQYPGLLDRNTAISKRLLCQRFIEAIVSSEKVGGDAMLDTILECGREVQTSMGDDPMLLDILGLLAYATPSQSPLAHLLDPSRRGPLAASVVDAIFEFQGKPLRASLESIFAQTSCCIRSLHEQGAPEAAGLSADSLFYLDQ